MGLLFLLIAGVSVTAWVVWEALTAPEDPSEKDAEEWHAEAEDFRKE